MYKIGLKLKGFVCIDYILFPVRYMTIMLSFAMLYIHVCIDISVFTTKKNTTTCTYMGKQLIANAYLLLF